MNNKVIAAVRTSQELEKAVKSNVEMIFMLVPNIEDIKSQAEIVHSAGKKLFIHIDLAEGIGKDEYGISCNAVNRFFQGGNSGFWRQTIY